MQTRVRITGFGGQGVITAGFILGKAATIGDDKHAIFTQSYGPEARGSACSAQVVVSDKKILYPFIKEQDVIVAMSQEGFDKYIAKTVPKGILIIDEDLVDTSSFPEKLKKSVKIYKIPATRMAEKDAGHRVVTNIIMLGFFTAVTKIVTPEAMTKAVLDSVPSHFADLNKKAISLGMEHFKPAAKKPAAKKKKATAKS